MCRFEAGSNNSSLTKVTRDEPITVYLVTLKGGNIIKITDKAKLWIKASCVRSVKTVAETALAVIGTNSMGVTDVDWIGLLSACALSGVITLLTCVKGLPEVKN